MKKCNINYNESFIINNFSNTDDRIYKFMIKEKIVKNNTFIITQIINTIFNKNIPGKYILRRLKSLSMIIPNFNNYSNNIIMNCISLKNIPIITVVLKYYYNSPLQQNNIYDIINYLFYYSYPLINDSNLVSININEIYIKLYDLLSTNTEKNMLVIAGLFKLGTSFGKTIIDGEKDFSNLASLIKKYFDEIDYVLNNIQQINAKEFKSMVDNIGFHNVSSCFHLSNLRIIKTISI
jgi:hypothetical protein